MKASYAISYCISFKESEKKRNVEKECIRYFVTKENTRRVEEMNTIR